MQGYKNILLAFFLAEFGKAMFFVTVTWLLYEITNDALYTGALVSLGFFPGLILNLVFGVIVDRFNRKNLAVLANVICTIALSILLLLLFTMNKIEPWLIIGVHMILQVTGSLFRPAIQAFIAEFFEKNQLPKIYSSTSTSSIIGGLLGSLAGGVIISFISVAGAISSVTASFFVSSLLLYVVKNKRIVGSKVIKKPILKDIRDGFIYIKKNKLLLGLFVIMFNGQLVFHTSVGFLSVYAVEYLFTSVTVYGFMDATISIGGVVAGILGTWWLQTGKNKIAVVSLLIVLVGLLFVGFAPGLPVAIVGVFLIGLGTTWIRVLLQSVQQMVTDSEYHGRMASYRMIGNQGSVVISAPLLGWIATNYGGNFIYLSLLIPTSICIIFALFQAKQKELVKVTKVA
ncbi:MFS transporter [Fredinandcohnia humi]